MRKNEKGRSMVEMLGVLAIIGVLSVGGIYGYSVAMNKYRANEIVQTASMLVTMARASNAGDGTAGPYTAADAGLAEAAVGGQDISAMSVSNAQSSDPVATVSVTLPADLCDAIEAIAPTDADAPAATRAGYIVDCTDAAE